MVILIGGNGCTGKTLMAQKLLEKYKIPYLSIDHLKMGLYRGDADYGSYILPHFLKEFDKLYIKEIISRLMILDMIWRLGPMRSGKLIGSGFMELRIKANTV